MKPNDERRAERPAGFNRSAKKTTQAPQTDREKTATAADLKEKKRREREAAKAYRAREKKAERAEKARARSKRRPEEKPRRGKAVLTGVIVFILLGLAAILIFGDHSRVVHQMPTIVLEGAETEEATEEGT